MTNIGMWMVYTGTVLMVAGVMLVLMFGGY